MPSFDDFAKKLEELQQDVPKIFEKVAKKGAIKFVNEAKERTDNEGLVDTGKYKRSWYGHLIQPELSTYGVFGENSTEYASFLEYGHKIKGTNRRFKGRFVGNLSLNEARYYCTQELQKAIEKAIKKK